MKPVFFIFFLLPALFMGAAFAAPSTVTRNLSSPAPAPCSNLTVTLAVSVNSTDTFYAIDESPPAEWAITSPGTGSISHSGHIKWLTLPPAISTTFQYTLAVPCNAAGSNEFSGEYGFNDAIVHSIAGQSSANLPGKKSSNNTTSIPSNSSKNATKPSPPSSPASANASLAQAQQSPPSSQDAQGGKTQPILATGEPLTPPANENAIASMVFDSSGGLSMAALAATAAVSFMVLTGSLLVVWRKMNGAA